MLTDEQAGRAQTPHKVFRRQLAAPWLGISTDVHKTVAASCTADMWKVCGRSLDGLRPDRLFQRSEVGMRLAVPSRRWSLHWEDAQLSSTDLALRARAPPDIPDGSCRPVFPHSLKHMIGPYGAQRSTLGGMYSSRRGIATMFLKKNQRHQRIARGQLSLGAKSRRNRP